MRRKRFLSLVLMLLILVMLAGCGSQEVLNPDADSESITDEQWAYEVVNESLNKLFNDGDAVKSDVKDNEIFKFDEDGKIVFGHGSENGYNDEDFKTDAPVIWGAMDVSDTDKDKKITVTVCKNSSLKENEKLPEYFPTEWLEKKNTKTFAESRGRCKYLVVYGGLITDITEKYYFGGVDRTTVSTVVIVFDAVEKKVVHIEEIGVDKPENRTTHPTGQIKTNEAITYMRQHCR